MKKAKRYLFFDRTLRDDTDKILIPFYSYAQVSRIKPHIWKSF